MLVRPILTYGSESWPLNARMKYAQNIRKKVIENNSWPYEGK
jgi:hypothetical protein